MWADKLCLQRFAAQGQPFAALTSAALTVPVGADYTSDTHPDWADLCRTRVMPDVAIKSWLGELPPQFVLAPMRYSNLKGVLGEHPAWQALSHFFNHQTHHRGQLTTLLTQANVEAGVTDLIALV